MTKAKRGLTAKGDERKFVDHHYVDHADENELSDGCETNDDHEQLMRYRQYAANIKKEGTMKVKCGPFPFKLHMILSEIESDGKGHIISWLPHGRAFAIHKQGLFQSEIMHRYFKQSKITSFHRQLNLYGFQRLTQGRDCGSYYNEYFLRGKPFLSRKIIRIKVKGTKIRAASSPDDEPNFYQMPPVGVREFTPGYASLGHPFMSGGSGLYSTPSLLPSGAAQIANLLAASSQISSGNTSGMLRGFPAQGQNPLSRRNNYMHGYHQPPPTGSMMFPPFMGNNNTESRNDAQRHPLSATSSRRISTNIVDTSRQDKKSSPNSPSSVPGAGYGLQNPNDGVSSGNGRASMSSMVSGALARKTEGPPPSTDSTRPALSSQFRQQFLSPDGTNRVIREASNDGLSGKSKYPSPSEMSSNNHNDSTISQDDELDLYLLHLHMQRERHPRVAAVAHGYQQGNR